MCWSKRLKGNDKTIICIDCGKEVEVDSKDTETCRCEKCRKIHLKEINRKKKKKWYDKQKIKT